jgi:hypothetical protein
MIGILAPESGGGTFISGSCEGGGQITPLLSESLSPSGSPDLPDCPSFIGVQDEDGDAFSGGAAFVCAKAVLAKRNEQKIAAIFFIRSPVQQLPGTPGVMLGLMPRMEPEVGWLVAEGTPFCVVALPVAGVPTPALPGTEPNDVADPLHGAPAPARPELGSSGEETAGEMIVLCPTGGPEGIVGVVGVVVVPCASAVPIEIKTTVATAITRFFIRYSSAFHQLVLRLAGSRYFASRSWNSGWP